MLSQVLFVSLPSHRAMPAYDAMRVATNPAQAIAVTDINAAKKVLDSSFRIEAIVCNAPNLELLQSFKHHNPQGKSILLSSGSFEEYSQALNDQEFKFLDHVITNRSPAEWTVNELRVTLQKILSKDIFGLDKYLQTLAVCQKVQIKENSERSTYPQLVANYIRDNRLGRNIATVGYSISEELLMNAIYDAPIAANSDLQREERSNNVDLPQEFCPELHYGFDGKILGIAVRDPFGAMSRDKYFSYLKKVILRDKPKNLIDEKESGAGLGLYKILFNSHAIVCNIKSEKITEVLVFIDTKYQAKSATKTARSIHFFSASE